MDLGIMTEKMTHRCRTGVLHGVPRFSVVAKDVEDFALLPHQDLLLIYLAD